ncbi:hypothetical protein ACHSBP_18970 [Pseudoalteromonas sp. XMcav1-K]|uniref:hypothetical protein n=1 Tax=Pseudoalteromonas sp. XMcav1-K TaxID=3374372 RepID=UPI0037583E09
MSNDCSFDNVSEAENAAKQIENEEYRINNMNSRELKLMSKKLGYDIGGMSLTEIQAIKVSMLPRFTSYQAQAIKAAGQASAGISAPSKLNMLAQFADFMKASFGAFATSTVAVKENLDPLIEFSTSRAGNAQSATFYYSCSGSTCNVRGALWDE